MSKTLPFASFGAALPFLAACSPFPAWEIASDRPGDAAADAGPTGPGDAIVPDAPVNVDPVPDAGCAASVEAFAAVGETCGRPVATEGSALRIDLPEGLIRASVKGVFATAKFLYLMTQSQLFRAPRPPLSRDARIPSCAFENVAADITAFSPLFGAQATFATAFCVRAGSVVCFADSGATVTHTFPTTSLRGIARAGDKLAVPDTRSGHTVMSGSYLVDPLVPMPNPFYALPPGWYTDSPSHRLFFGDGAIVEVGQVNAGSQQWRALTSQTWGTEQSPIADFRNEALAVAYALPAGNSLMGSTATSFYPPPSSDASQLPVPVIASAATLRAGQLSFAYIATAAPTTLVTSTATLNVSVGAPALSYAGTGELLLAGGLTNCQGSFSVLQLP